MSFDYRYQEPPVRSIQEQPVRSTQDAGGDTFAKAILKEIVAAGGGHQWLNKYTNRDSFALSFCLIKLFNQIQYVTNVRCVNIKKIF